MRSRLARIGLAAIAAGIACAPRGGADAPAPDGRGQKVTRGMLAVRVSEDGRIEVDGKRVRDAKKRVFLIVDAEATAMWIVAESAR